METKYENLSKKDLIKEIQKLKAEIETTDNLDEKSKNSLNKITRHEKELSALMQGAKAVLEQKGFLESSRAIFDYCTNLIGATSGYVALLSDKGEENEVLFLEAGGLPCSVDPELPMPIRGLRAETYTTNKAVYHNDFMNSEWTELMPSGHVILKNVMFAPLVLEGKTVGIIGLANKESNFDENDAKMATGFGELAAIALQNSRYLDERTKAGEDQRISNGAVTLDGSDSNIPDGVVPEYSWALNNRYGSSQSTDGVNPTVTGLERGIYDVTLTVSGNDGTSDTDTMVVTSCFITSIFD